VGAEGVAAYVRVAAVGSRGSVEAIALLAGHNQTATTELVYRHQIVPALTRALRSWIRFLASRWPDRAAAQGWTSIWNAITECEQRAGDCARVAAVRCGRGSYGMTVNAMQKNQSAARGHVSVDKLDHARYAPRSACGSVPRLLRRG